MAEVRILKMVDGEEIIAQVTEKFEEGEKQWVLTNPRLLINTPEGLAMVPFPSYIKQQPISVRTDHIKYPLVPVDALKEKYQEMVGAIMVPSKKLIV